MCTSWFLLKPTGPTGKIKTVISLKKENKMHGVGTKQS